MLCHALISQGGGKRLSVPFQVFTVPHHSERVGRANSLYLPGLSQYFPETPGKFVRRFVLIQVFPHSQIKLLA